MSENKQYENEYKVQAVKLAKKIGAVNAANELQIPVNTLYGWIRKARIGSFDIGCGERSPEESLNIAGKIRFYCKAMQVSRQAFYGYLERKDTPWKYQPLAAAMLKIHDEDEENADYGRVRMYQALRYQKEIGKLDGIKIPCEATVRCVMERINLIHRPKRKPNGITKADREARKSEHIKAHGAEKRFCS